MKNKKLRKPGPKKKLISVVLIMAVLAAGAYYFRFAKSGPVSQEEQDIPAQQETVEYAPATQDEISSSDDNKSQEVKPPQDNTGSGSVNNNLPITITSVDSPVIRAQVGGVVEDGGTCTATYKKNGVIYQKTSSGLSNVSYTQCSAIRPDSGVLSSGEWSVIVTYKSGSGSGSSSEFKVRV